VVFCKKLQANIQLKVRSTNVRFITVIPHTSATSEPGAPQCYMQYGDHIHYTLHFVC